MDGAAVSAADVVIVGGGPAGLSAAIELRRRGAGRVVVYERELHAGGIPRHTAHLGYGVRDLHGLVWEWVDDYAAMMVSADSRDQNDPDRLKFCGAAALSMRDRDNYALLMRIAMLSSLKAADTTTSMGFRCARDLKETSK